MELSKKIIITSVAALMAVTPMTAIISQPSTVAIAATTKQKRTILVNEYTTPVNKNGKAVKKFHGKKYPYFSKNTQLKYYGKQVKIKNAYYYSVGSNAYVPVSDIISLNGKGTLVLNHNSYVYNKKGKRTGKLLRKGMLTNYLGSTKQNDAADNLYFFESDNKYQLSTTSIKGSQYYQIGKNQYIKVNNIDSINSSPLYFSQTTVTVKRKTNQLFRSGTDRALFTGKFYKKGQKLTVDQQGGMDVLSNGFPDAYHIKGTDYYIWARDVTPRQNLQSIAYSLQTTNTATVRTTSESIPIYSYTGQVSTPSGFAWPNSTELNVDGKIYLWNEEENKAELYYHLTNRYQVMANLKTSPSYPVVDKMNTVNVGDALVKASDVKFIEGRTLIAANTAAQAEANAKIAVSETEETSLKDLVDKAASIQSTDKYKLSSYNKRYNYDQAVSEAKSALNGSLSAAQAQYLIWNLRLTKSELNGAKVKVNNLKKLTSDEIIAINALVSAVYSKTTDTEDLYGSAIFSKVDYSTFELSITDENQSNKVVSTKMMKTSDFAEKR